MVFDRRRAATAGAQAWGLGAPRDEAGDIACRDAGGQDVWAHEDARHLGRLRAELLDLDPGPQALLAARCRTPPS